MASKRVNSPTPPLPAMISTHHAILQRSGLMFFNLKGGHRNDWLNMKFYDLGFGRGRLPGSTHRRLQGTWEPGTKNLLELSVNLLECLGSMLISNSLFKIELVSQESARWFSYIKPLSGWKARGSTSLLTSYLVVVIIKTPSPRNTLRMASGSFPLNGPGGILAHRGVPATKWSAWGTETSGLLGRGSHRPQTIALEQRNSECKEGGQI